MLRRISISCCHFSCTAGKHGSSSSLMDAAEASRCPWICFSGFNDLETVSELSRIGFASWRCHSPGKHLHGLPGSWWQLLIMLFEAVTCQPTALACSQEHITLQTGLKVQPAKPPASNNGQKQIVMNPGDEYHNRADTKPFPQHTLLSF